MEYLLLAAAGYLVGSIPSGLLAGRLKGIDVRAHGSGKTGATNVSRALGPAGFAVVFVADFAKGFLPVFVAGAVFGTPIAQVVAGLGALAGHNWSLYLRFSGGRGVATGVGGVWGISPALGLAITLVTVAIIAASRYVSLGSIAGAVMTIPAGILALQFGWLQPDHLLYLVPGSLIVLYQHRDNMERLRSGTERKLGERALP